MKIELQIYTKNFLFVDGPQKFLQNHKRQGGILFEFFYFNQISPKNKEIIAKNSKAHRF
jgi:hypothetical protein